MGPPLDPLGPLGALELQTGDLLDLHLKLTRGLGVVDYKDRCRFGLGDSHWGTDFLEASAMKNKFNLGFDFFSFSLPDFS